MKAICFIRKDGQADSRIMENDSDHDIIVKRIMTENESAIICGVMEYGEASLWVRENSKPLQRRCAKFEHGKALDIDGEDYIAVGCKNGKKYQVYIGGKFIGEYDSEGEALDVKDSINLALASAYVCDELNNCNKRDPDQVKITVTFRNVKTARTVAKFLQRVTYDDAYRRAGGDTLEGKKERAYIILDGVRDIEDALEKGGFSMR
jgi:hypothetical protein